MADSWALKEPHILNLEPQSLEGIRVSWMLSNPKDSREGNLDWQVQVGICLGDYMEYSETGDLCLEQQVSPLG